MFIDEFTKQLSRSLELDPPLASNEIGEYHLAIDEKVHITFSPHEGGLAIQAPVGKCPPAESDEREDFFRNLMLANLIGQGTGRSMLGLSPTGEEVWLILALPYEIPYLECRALLEEFINYTHYWLGEMEEFHAGSPEKH